jgi:predicted nucleotidyltransferase component of viral defense system
VTKTPKNVAASINARLLKRARERNEDFLLVLTRYANERFLYRLANSQHASQFVLKGAALFTVWMGELHRTTRDLDLLGFGDSSVERIRSVMAEVMAIEEPDGLAFEAASLRVAPIREEQEYGGVRSEFFALLGPAKVKLQVDVGFGDAITPAAEFIEFPPLLDLPAPRLRAYPRETVVAEKLEAMVKLDLANSRMKDFYDLAVLARDFEFESEPLVRAIRATFDRRKTALPPGLPVALTATFSEDAAKKTQWSAFVRKADADDVGDLPAAVESIRVFAARPLSAAEAGHDWQARWNAGGPWSL